MRRITKKIYSAVFFCIVILICAIVWESVYNNHSEEAWVYKFEKRLHRQERVADEILKQFKDSVDIDQYRSQKDMIFVGLKNGKLFFWTDEIVGMNGLYDLLPLENRFAKINNSYYEIRRRNYKEIEYIALLHIKDDYPYTNKYIKNHFGKFLKVKAENVDNIDVSPEVLPGGTAIKDIEGNILFYIRHSADYKDRSVNYILLSLYVLFFLTLFYIYGLVLRNTTSLKRQLVYFALFSFMLMLLHYMMYEYRVPDSLYRLRIFDPSKSPGGFVLSVGDLLITVFSLAQILYLSLSNLRFNYKSKTLRRYRYVVLTVFLLLILGYMVIFSNTIGALIESKDVYLNIARIIEIDMLSIIAFLSIIVAGLIMVIFIDGMVSVMKNVVPLKKLLLFVAIVTIPTACIFACLKNDVLFIGTALILIVFSLAILNCYVTKREIQRSIYLLIIFLLSIHIVLVERNLEEKRELLLRKEFAMELINERDYNFEKKLLELDGRINDSEEIKSFARNYDEEGVLNYLYSGFLEMAGYNYLSNIIFCRSEDLLNVGTEGKQYNCHEYFNQLLQKSGVRIDNTHFYAIDEFDGVASYVGKFVLGDTYLILRFDSGDESEGVGYPQLLSRRSVEGNDITYPYSYAKYKNSQLIKSSGFFNYYKSLDLLGKYDTIQNVSIKDDHSHMFIPVDDENVLIISLHKNFFSIYYLNILYVFFICILFSSYGMFFNLNSGMNFKKGSLKARIKNSILSLVFSLFIILTFFSIWITTKGYEKRHYIKAIELLKYLNKELEQLDCVEYWECPHITENLAGWSEVFMADINIYSDRGRLVATSRPEIFSNGFSGYLVDPVAFQRIIDEKSTNYVVQKKIGEMSYMSAYVPLQIGEDKLYILNIPYFAQNDELNQNIFILIIVMMNIAA
ncbi:sensor histidine kinase, partial [Odoribacter sp. OttesenSCG-928-A06]|nr:sensor histidine kinase [Odoribacter sp. OttesenSCG-928-A06]